MDEREMGMIGLGIGAALTVGYYIVGAVYGIPEDILKMKCKSKIVGLGSTVGIIRGIPDPPCVWKLPKPPSDPIGGIGIGDVGGP